MAWVSKSCHPLSLLTAGVIFALEGIGVPIPVEIPLGITTLRLRHCGNTYWEMVFLMWAATCIGNLVGYYLGYFGGRPLALKLIGWFRVKPETWQKIEGWFHRHGLKVVIATRWINWGFAQNMWLSGITRMPIRTFLPIMVINNFFWAMGWIWLSVAAVNLFGPRLWSYWERMTWRVPVTALVLVLLVVGAMWLWRRRQRKRVALPGPGEDE